MPSLYTEPARAIPVSAEPDVLVVGGGSAGIAAAVSAARAGARTLLVERWGFAGGTLTGVTLGGFCGGFVREAGELVPIVGGVYQEVVDRLSRVGGVLPPKSVGKVYGVPYDPSMLRLVADEILADSGVALLFHSYAVAVHGERGRIDAVVIENKAGRSAIRPRFVIDCSGDGDVAAAAGAAFEIGCEGVTQAGSTMFRLANVDTSRFQALSRDEIRALLETAVAEGVALPRTAIAVYPGPVPGVAHLNATKLLDPDGRPFNLVDPHDLTEAEQEGRRQAFLYCDVARRYLPGFERARVVDMGAQVGIRETRRITGDHVLSGNDVRTGIKPPDSIAFSSWPIELHGHDRATRWEHLPDGDYYGIPYRCLTVYGFVNLLVAGRNLSATHEAQASARVAATCFAMGQAAGIAATLALGSRGDSRAFNAEVLQDRLIDQGVIASDRLVRQEAGAAHGNKG